MIRHHEKHGTLTKTVDIRIIVPGRDPVHHRVHAQRGKWITEDGVQAILEQEADQLEKGLPQFEFRLIELSDAKFNFVGEPVAPQAQQKTGGVSHAPIDSPAGAAFPTDEARSIIPGKRQHTSSDLLNI